MSYSYGYNPKVNHPYSSNNNVNMESGGFQTPFFFGGSRVPTDLFLPKAMYNGSSGSGLHKGRSQSVPTNFDMVFSKRYSRESGFHMGSLSKTHPGDLDFTTKKGDKCFVRKGHRLCIPHTLPFIKKK